MGETHVNVTIRNPAELHRCWEGSFLVDTGATDTQVPRRHLEAIGLSPLDSREYLLADGRVELCDRTVARIEFEGTFSGSTVIFGEDESIPLLGLTALESTGFDVDPVDGKLKQTRTLRR
ncbi:MAG: clan AA aspartic protease [bacterium]|nr:clan AA aspartic protease [bacterium]MDE0668500.1 clan AA aspartic protease [bacterium]MXZ29858.1 clan AA aspartic protease [Acidimicrobiia bacterium]MYB23551.1 clan AA aspartic protease [Acidimicrobiia bacterium]